MRTKQKGAVALAVLVATGVACLAEDQKPEAKAKDAAKTKAQVDPVEHEKKVRASLQAALMEALETRSPEAKEAYERQLEAYINDPIIFGERSYATAAEIKDTNVIRYLPKAATEIQLLKQANGHFARYKIAEDDFHAFLADVWKRYKADSKNDDGWVSYSEEEIAEAKEGSHVGQVEYRKFVEELGWKKLENATAYSGPRRRSYAGAEYFYDRDAGIAYHDAGYW